MWIVGAIVVVSLVIALIFASSMSQRKQQRFVLPSINGGEVDLSSLRGRVIFLSFGATWCPPCREELPILQELADRYKNTPVSFFWITIDDPEVSNEELKEFASALRFRLPILRDPEGNLLLHFGSEGVPTTVILDQNGHPAGSAHVGFAGKENYLSEMSQALDSLLSKK